MRHRTPRGPALLLLYVGYLIAPVSAQIAFETATIRRSQSDAPGPRSSILPGGNFTAENNTLKQLVTVAYQLPFRLVEGGPDWVNSEDYDVTARSAEGSKRTPIDVFPMLQQLLRDRFALAVRKENRVTDAFALVRAKEQLGPGLRRSEMKCDLCRARRRRRRRQRRGRYARHEPVGASSLGVPSE